MLTHQGHSSSKLKVIGTGTIDNTSGPSILTHLHHFQDHIHTQHLNHIIILPFQDIKHYRTTTTTNRAKSHPEHENAYFKWYPHCPSNKLSKTTHHNCPYTRPRSSKPSNSPHNPIPGPHHRLNYTLISYSCTLFLSMVLHSPQQKTTLTHLKVPHHLHHVLHC